MAEKFDVASRLAEGRPAVDNIQTYVWACHVLGYANPDLTLHASQVRDWYGSEDGLDLRALDADCAALEAAVAATEDALTRQDDQLGALSAAWQGRSADLSREFLRRHGEASAAAAAAVRTTADALATLRDNLWHTVDGKVAAAIAADDRAPDEWLAAAHTVTTGAGDRAAASERIDQEVKPFVDNDIRADWLTAMRSAMAAVTDLYDAATAELTAEPDAVFDVPGDLGPSWTPPPRDDEVATVPAAASVGCAARRCAAVMECTACTDACAGAACARADAATAACRRSTRVQPHPQWRHRRRHRHSADCRTSAAACPDSDSSSPMRSAACWDRPTRRLADTPDIDEPGRRGSSTRTSTTNWMTTQKTTMSPSSPQPIRKRSLPPRNPSRNLSSSPPTPANRLKAPVEPPPPEEPAPTPVPVPPPPEPAPPPSPAAAAETPCEIAADELPQVGE